jgi:hypothetical protein
MSNTVIISLPAGQQQGQVVFPVQGDGISLTVALPLSAVGVSGTPVAISLLSATNAAGADVSLNIVSSIISGNNINVLCVAGFSTIYSLIYVVTFVQAVATTIVTGTVQVTQPSGANLQSASTLNAETTKVIGVVRNSDGAGNLFTSNSTTPTTHFAQDINIPSILGTAPTTVGFLDIKGADGNIFVRNATAANFLCTATLAAGAAVIGHVLVDSGTLAVTGTFWQATQPVSGTFWQATQPVSGTITAVTAITNPLPAGTNVIGHVIVDSGTITTVSTVTAVTTVNASRTVGSTGATLDAAIGGVAPTNAQWHTNAPATASAASLSATFINGVGTAVNLKASAGNLYGLSLTNETSSVAYVEFFNIAIAPVLGTTAVVFAIKLPASANLTLTPGALALMNFTTGIGFAVTTLENGTVLAGVTGMIFFK